MIEEKRVKGAKVKFAGRLEVRSWWYEECQRKKKEVRVLDRRLKDRENG